MPAGWAAAATAVAGLASAAATRSAAKSQKKSTEAAIAEQERQFDLAREDQRSYRDVGGQALNALAGELGLAGITGQRAGDPRRDWCAAGS